MSNLKPLSPEQLCHQCTPDHFTFETTAELVHELPIIGQERVFDAMRFGTEIQREGYNLFALGPAGIGKYSTIKHFLDRKAKGQLTPSDWCYVNNFSDSHRPRILEFPAGLGRQFKWDNEALLDRLKSAVPSVFESDDYRTRKQIIEEEFRERRDNAFDELRKEAQKKGLTLLRTPEGLAFAPVRDGNVMSPDDFRKLSEEEREGFEEAIAHLQGQLQPILQQLPRWEQEGRDRVKALNKELTIFAVGHHIDALRKKYTEFPKVIDYLDALQKDVVDNAENFLTPPDSPEKPVMAGQTPHQGDGSPDFRRYQVNLIVDNKNTKGAPVVYEDNPTMQNLIGQSEHIASMGALVTDFTLIKPGALHRANGGYLILDSNKLLIKPQAWDALKRTLWSREIRIESLGQALSLVSTVTLKPQPIPLNVKVVLLGERHLYYLLIQHDPEFDELFKVAVDFEDRIERTPENDLQYAQFLAGLIHQDGLRPFHRSAIARVIEHGSRLAGDSERLSIHRRIVTDLLRESDYWAGSRGEEIVSCVDVQRALDTQIGRSDRVRKRMQEQINRGTILIDVEGAKEGQINGLSVISLGQIAFGRPTRITARVRVGRGEVIDIEREVELGGPLHSKGVLILCGFLGARYSTDHPLSLSATLVFEQSYGGVDGDSASSAELYALLSALSEIPIKQSFAVTGSVNQHGQVQAIGGVNEKIEGFFDICEARGLTGDQGVLIPASNVKHLMLRKDVVEACKKGLFGIYAVETIDQGIEILTGVTAGQRDENGDFPPETVNYRVEARLIELAQKQMEHSRHQDTNDSDDKNEDSK